MARSVLDSAFVDSTNQEFNVDNNYNKPVVGIDRDGVLNVDLGTYVTSPEYF